MVYSFDFSAPASIQAEPERNISMNESRTREPNKAQQASYQPLSEIAPDLDCLFLDFDGTLVEFAEHPDQVDVPPQLQSDVTRLFNLFGGALAVVSGRRVNDIDRFLAPLLLPVAGVHGLMRRDAAGRLHQARYDEASLGALASRLQKFVDVNTGLLLERKPGSIALHYRRRPEMASACTAAIHSALETIGPAAGSYNIMAGKMVIEARASASTKAVAIAEFMTEPPFSGRRPIFAGDDITDEDGFIEINARGGISIKVGDGETEAACRVRDIAAFRQWLQSIG